MNRENQFPHAFLHNTRLAAHPFGSRLDKILSDALAAVEPESVILKSIRFENETLRVLDQAFRLEARGTIILVGAGKAGAPMAEAVYKILGDRISSGLVVVKDGHLGDTGGRVGPIELIEAGHPIPDDRSVAAARRLSDLAASATEHDLVPALLSGGGSALTAFPSDGISLGDLRKTAGILLRAGADIRELNTVRKHCSEIGGGGLARAAMPARVVSLIISDVVGSPLDVIASGPTSPDPTTFADALEILRRYNLEPALPNSVVERLRDGAEGRIPETAKSDDPWFRRVSNFILADNGTALEAARKTAESLGFETEVLSASLQGEAREIGRRAANLVHERISRRSHLARPLLLLAGGETTVTVTGNGLGGRNLETALGAVRGLAGVRDVILVAFATDGGDGPTDSAGAFVTGETLDEGLDLGLDPDDFLARNDSHAFFRRLGALLRPGSTRTNVNDLLLIVIAP